MTLSGAAPWITLAVVIPFFLWVDLKLLARNREPRFREAALWSVGWLVLSLAAALVVVAARDTDDAIGYTTVYLIERSLSLDNLVVFMMLFSYFAVPVELRARALSWGIAAALVLRGAAILGGVALIERFHFVLYPLGVLLLLLAWRMLRGVEDGVDPESNLLVRAVRRVYPVTREYRGDRWFVRLAGRRHATPLLLCVAAIVFADIAFAVDSIPAAFAITRDPFVIWMGNAFALLGLRALFVLVEGLMHRFRYLDQTIAVVLAIVAVKILIEELVHIGPLGSLAIIAAVFAAGMIASVLADRRERGRGAAAAPLSVVAGALAAPMAALGSLPAIA